MSLIEEGDQKKVRMAFLSIICSHAVNGVAFLHSELIKTTIFKDFYEMFPSMFQNKTNGVTPRRWIHCCNEGLSNLLTEQLGGDMEDWINNMTSLREIAAYSKDKEFQEKFIAVKVECKKKL